MRVQELTNGHAYSENGVTLIFRTGDLAPQAVINAGMGRVILTQIDYPERYGAWGTRRERTLYVRAFTADRVVTAS